LTQQTFTSLHFTSLSEISFCARHLEAGQKVQIQLTVRKKIRCLQSLLFLLLQQKTQHLPLWFWLLYCCSILGEVSS